jgi:hypothetical protein
MGIWYEDKFYQYQRSPFINTHTNKWQKDLKKLVMKYSPKTNAR